MANNSQIAQNMLKRDTILCLMWCNNEIGMAHSGYLDLSPCVGEKSNFKNVFVIFHFWIWRGTFEFQKTTSYFPLLLIVNSFYAILFQSIGMTKVSQRGKVRRVHIDLCIV